MLLHFRSGSHSFFKNLLTKSTLKQTDSRLVISIAKLLIWRNETDQQISEQKL